MARRLRFVPPEGALVEVTCRTVQSRFLLTPSAELNEIILGVLGRAQRLYPVEVCGYVFLSTHYHLLLVVEDAQQLADFVGYFNSNLAREVARRTGWTDKIWARRYQAIPVSEELNAQVARMAYILTHGAKEGLVESPAQWPGVHCVRPLLAGESAVEGLWFDRTREHCARMRGESFERRKFTQTEKVELSRLPCWKNLTSEAYREQIAGLVRVIEQQAREQREATGLVPLGVKAILAQKPFDRPKKPKKSPAPLFHAFTKATRKALWEAYGWFVAAFQEAAEKLRAGKRDARFPTGSFPPRLPFVTAAAG
jgi:REP element-mobilizing transposase RayT